VTSHCSPPHPTCAPRCCFPRTLLSPFAATHSRGTGRSAASTELCLHSFYFSRLSIYSPFWMRTFNAFTGTPACTHHRMHATPAAACAPRLCLSHGIPSPVGWAFFNTLLSYALFDIFYGSEGHAQPSAPSQGISRLYHPTRCGIAILRCYHRTVPPHPHHPALHRYCSKGSWWRQTCLFGWPGYVVYIKRTVIHWTVLLLPSMFPRAGRLRRHYSWLLCDHCRKFIAGPSMHYYRHAV